MNKRKPGYILMFMLAICIVFGTGVSAVHNATQDMLEKNTRLHRNRVICRAFLVPVENENAQAYEEAMSEFIRVETRGEGARKRNIYFRKDAQGQGDIGFDISGMGFWERINGIVVLTGDLNEMVNIQFFDHKETPGLGARIEESWFTSQFKGLKIAWNKPERERIIIGPSPDPNAANRVDAITGATQTSIALMRFLNQELEKIRTLNLGKNHMARTNHAAR
jgi:Na+-transporting NADH:ubiquinone oxidoreductase subunit C